MSAYIGIALSPFMALILCAFARWASQPILKKLPEGRLKSILFFSWRS